MRDRVEIERLVDRIIQHAWRLAELIEEAHHLEIIAMGATITTQGATIALRANPVNAAGATIPDANTISWLNDNTTAVTVTDNGDGTATVTGVANGTANIGATDGSVTSSTPFVVSVSIATGSDTVTDLVIEQVS